ncbi:hypothetical protein STENM223S_01634 [Streptomyces tendae]
MSLAPRAVLVHRRTEYEELLARHGTHGQAAFFLSSRGRSIDEVARRHDATLRALREVASAVPLTWRSTRVERADLDRFLFAPEDVVIVVGQDGLVANTAKYLSGQPVVGIDTDPGRNPGVLVRHRCADAAGLLRAATAARDGGGGVEELTMVEAVADDTQRLPGARSRRPHEVPGPPGKPAVSGGSGASPDGGRARAAVRPRPGGTEEVRTFPACRHGPERRQHHLRRGLRRRPPRRDRAASPPPPALHRRLLTTHTRPGTAGEAPMATWRRPARRLPCTSYGTTNSGVSGAYR